MLIYISILFFSVVANIYFFSVQFTLINVNYFFFMLKFIDKLFNKIIVKNKN